MAGLVKIKVRAKDKVPARLRVLRTNVFIISTYVYFTLADLRNDLEKGWDFPPGPKRVTMAPWGSRPKFFNFFRA
jgi:hypothetical protein